MCTRRSMGCVYGMWQSMFADIINNKTESYIDIDIYMYDRHLTPDCTSDLTYTLMCAIHITVYLLYLYHLLFQ